LRAGVGLEAVLADCAALGAAAVLAPVAGEIDRAAYRRQAAGMVLETVDRVGR
jgi:tagatose 6-phosphate kinase